MYIIYYILLTVLAVLWVHLVLHPHGFAPTFLKLDWCSPGGGFYSYHIHQGNISYKERKFVRKKLSFMHTIRFNTFLKDGCNSVLVQFHVYRIKL